ncbi:aspartate/glutamate racemase family protein [Enterovibrio sp. ZSDZ42]|uniref:Aspartate/glutamate racemase family protein n=1 Tax=Enterovibrio gelatinilyticus TaxID=2899819 RepID=A0ABT5R6U1_9GAMM|nr:aspartate/glutamate racemase family protein [Enterovibrio sp. ZSDZ42]MDD1795704.1 aspartate/glutamate racemase family protein [Enterovibrio sp. ZSDZ42]
MTITVINPNGSASMTKHLEQGCNDMVLSHHTLEFQYCANSPLSIEGFSDGAAAAHHLADYVKHREQSGMYTAGYVVACFDDTGVDAAREYVQCPVVGIGEAAMQFASLLGSSFVVMTTLQRSVPIIERNIERYGLRHRCAGVFASNIPVLALEGKPNNYDKMLTVSREALSNRFGEVLVLGCAGMSQWQEKLQEDLGVPVIDGVKSAIKIVAALSDLGLNTSKALSYAYPEQKHESMP